jgi:hypothetical protein
MADLEGYIGPDVAGISYTFVGNVPGTLEDDTLSLLPAAVTTSITTLMNSMILQGWTNPTLMDGDQDGTLAVGIVNAYLWPYHAPDSGDASCVPDTFGGALIGIFDGNYYEFYDPLATPPDPNPTGGTLDGYPIIGVACGSSENATIADFAAEANAYTPWTWSFSGTVGTVTAQHTGPNSNVDSGSPAGFWAPNVGYWSGGPDTIAPTGGGWNVYSTAAPQTGDQFRLLIYEGDFGGLYPAFDLEMPTGSGNVVTYQLAGGHYNYGVSGYQLVFRQIAGELPLGNVGGNNFIASALNVPSEMGPVTFTVSSVTNPYGSTPVEIDTSTPHGLAMQDRVKISGATGATQINGAWWVAKIVSPTAINISPDPLVFEFGTGASYTGSGQVYALPSGSSVNISAIQNDEADPVLFTTLTAHGFQPGDVVSTSSIGGIGALDGFWTVAEVPTPTNFEIAAVNGMLAGDGTTYTANSATLTSGIFQAMVMTSGLGGAPDNGVNDSALYGVATVACQGIFGSFSGESGTPSRTLSDYGIAIHPLYNGYGSDGVTSALKPVLLAPYVALRIVNGQEARLAGTFWNSFVQLNLQQYGTLETYNDVPYMAWVPHDITLGLLNATLFFRATD